MSVSIYGTPIVRSLARVAILVLESEDASMHEIAPVAHSSEF